MTPAQLRAIRAQWRLGAARPCADVECATCVIQALLAEVTALYIQNELLTAGLTSAALLRAVRGPAS